jgi:hypothetical protein
LPRFRGVRSREHYACFRRTSARDPETCVSGTNHAGVPTIRINPKDERSADPCATRRPSPDFFAVTPFFQQARTAARNSQLGNNSKVRRLVSTLSLPVPNSIPARVSLESEENTTLPVLSTAERLPPIHRLSGRSLRRLYRLHKRILNDPTLGVIPLPREKTTPSERITLRNSRRA